MNNLTIDIYGNKDWRDANGRLHNEYGPAHIGCADTNGYYIHGEIHREDGPSLIFNLSHEYWWYINGKSIC